MKGNIIATALFIICNLTINSCKRNTQCGIPIGSASSYITPSTAFLTWSSVPGSKGYLLQYRIAGGSIWSSVQTTTDTFRIKGLQSGSSYEWQVATQCAGLTSAFTSVSTFATSNCPAGFEGDSCKPMSLKFLSQYAVTDTGNGGGGQHIMQYTMGIQPDTTSPKGLFLINFGGVNNYILKGAASGTNFFVDDTIVGQDTIRNGNGNLNGNTLTFSYNFSGNHGPRTDHAKGMKQ